MIYNSVNMLKIGELYSLKDEFCGLGIIPQIQKFICVEFFRKTTNIQIKERQY